LRSHVRLAAAALAALGLVAALVAWRQLRGEALPPSGLVLLGAAALAAFAAGWSGARLGAARRQDGALLESRDLLQAALRESEERSRILAEASFEGIAITAQGVLLDCSDRMAEMLGAVRGDLLGRSVSEFIAPEHRDLVAEAQRSGRLEPYEHLMRRVDGSQFPVEVRARTAEIGGRALRISVIRDITERRRAEQALRVFQYSIDQASDAVFWMRRDGGFAYVNDQAGRSLGYTREELLRLHLWDIDPNFPRERWSERWAAFHEDRRGGAEQLASLHRRKDGSTFPVEVVAKHLWLGDEELHVAYVRDIGERRRTEEALSRSEASLQLALEAARLGDWSWDMVTGEVAWSARCKALYGLPPETVMTYQLFLACLHPDDRDRVDAALKRAVAERSAYDVEKRAIWPDGTLHWNATRGRVICNAAGEPVRLTGVTVRYLDLREADRLARQEAKSVVNLLRVVPEAPRSDKEIRADAERAVLRWERYGPFDAVARSPSAATARSPWATPWSRTPPARSAASTTVRSSPASPAPPLTP